MLELLTRNSQFEVECLLSSSYIASVLTTNHLHNPLLSEKAFSHFVAPLHHSRPFSFLDSPIVPIPNILFLPISCSSGQEGLGI